jgi:hypothetical protein
MLNHAIIELENRLFELDKHTYDSIDSLMRKIMRKYDVTAKELHFGFVNKNKRTPDDWIKNQMKNSEPKEELSLVQRIIDETCDCDEEPKNMKGHTSLSKLAQKHNVSPTYLKKQLEMGRKVEMEHTKNRDMATDIALQHLGEIPDYYTRLAQMENQKNESVMVPDMFGNPKYQFIDVIRPDPMLEEKEKRYPKGRRKGDPCWKNYKQVGMKMKSGREVPNCVPVEEETLPTRNGQNMLITVQWRSNIYTMQLFFPKSKIPNKTEIQFEANKIYPNCKLLTYRVAQSQPNMPIIQIQNSKSKNYLLNNGTIGEETLVEKIIKEAKSPAWQRSEGKNPEGGLNKKRIASYRKQNPGSKLSLAVTTDPSKLKKGSKKAKRRASYCARSEGQMEMWPKAARDPNSRLRKARRKWNCR